MTETTTSAAAPAQTRGFQAEVKQLLQLMNQRADLARRQAGQPSRRIGVCGMPSSTYSAPLTVKPCPA